MIKAAFFDIDGTLVSFSTHVISDTSLRSLAQLRSKGIKLFIASGRHLLIMDNLGGFSFDGYVCMNGSLIFNGGEVIYRHPMDRDDAEVIASMAMERKIPCAVFGESFVGMNIRDEVTRKILSMIRLDIPEGTDLVGAAKGDVYQYTMFIDKQSEQRELAPLLKNTCFTRWHPEFTDLIPSGISKAEGVDRVLRHLGISRDEIIAFGDGGNDVEMLSFAGIGVAMGNAAEDVQKIADYVTASVDEEGVTAALRHYGLL